MKYLIRTILLLTLIIFALAYFWFYQNLKITMNPQNITYRDESFEREKTIKVALIGDIHIFDTVEDYQKISNMLKDIDNKNPDLIIFAGDYTGSPGSISNMEKHRLKIAKLLSQSDKQKKIFVLGNYESWSNPEAWITAFWEEKANILNNETIQVNISGENLCVRGLGDYFTNMFQYTGFPEDCKNALKLTVTHDPAGAFHKDMEGLVLAAHTHCGQIRLPFIGALWIPSEAPLEATCGIYVDKKRTVFTTAGAGTTLLPIRIGTTSSWDLLTIRFSSTQ